MFALTETQRDMPVPLLDVRASWVLGNGYCPVCGSGVSPDMELVIVGDEVGLWGHLRCEREEESK